MGLLTSRDKFNKIKKNMVEQAEQQQAGDGNKNANENIIKMKKHNKYRFRLVYWIEEGTNLETPIIKIRKHFVKDEEGKWRGITCPKTLDIREGAKICKVCINNKQLWDSGVESDKDLYRKYKARFSGLVPVIVVNDPDTSENNGTVKLLKIPESLSDWIEKMVFGIDHSWKNKNKKNDENTTEDDDDQVGFDAFDLENGYDLLIDVQTKQGEDGEWASYVPSFSRKQTSVSNTEDEIVEAIKSFNIKDMIVPSTNEQIEVFFNKYVLGIEDKETTETKETSKTQVVEKPAPVKETKVEDSTETTETTEEDFDEDPEIQALLADIEKDVS